MCNILAASVACRTNAALAASYSIYIMNQSLKQNLITDVSHQPHGRKINPDQSELNTIVIIHAGTQACVCVSVFSQSEVMI